MMPFPTFLSFSFTGELAQSVSLFSGAACVLCRRCRCQCLLNTAQPVWCSLATEFPFSGQEFSCQWRRCRRRVYDRSLSQEDPLEEDMATHSSILAWEIPWTEGPGGLQSMGLQCVGHDWACIDTGKVKEACPLDERGLWKAKRKENPLPSSQ